MADASTPLGPLDPSLLEHLTRTLGQPESFLVGISDGRDVRAVGWVIGLGQMDAGSAGPNKRGTDVAIRLTVGGQLVTTRSSWTKGPAGSSGQSTGRVNSTPHAAYEWLLADGGGTLGRVSKAAWVQACRAVPPMADFEFEHVE